MIHSVLFMSQLSLDIIPDSNKDALTKKQLLSVIKKKRTQLKYLIIKTEMLRVNLEMAKQEYMVKVGSLFLKDNHLDLEIIRLQNILRLMKEGQKFEEASEEISQTYYAQQLEIEREQEKVRQEEEIFSKRESHRDEPTSDIKKVWKKLIARFHPDLVQEADEKKKRNEIMQRINRAYQEGDYDQLMKIEQDHMTDHQTSIDNLEEILNRLLREIEEQRTLFTELKESEWHEWMIKIDRAKRRHINVFAETERTLLNDIVAKLDVLKSLRDEIMEKEKNPNLF
jgi:hypothetical protein